VLVGFGATGLLLAPRLGGLLLLAVAVLGGVLFEAALVAPLWRFLFRFASSPAQSLESVLMDSAQAASGFDAAGCGLVAVELDGRVIQLLGTLRREDRESGVRVRAGDRVRIEDVDPARNRCTVSYLGR
jgi:translation initiation factor IF-1